MHARWTSWVAVMLVAGAARGAGTTPPLSEPNGDARTGKPRTAPGIASEPGPTRSLTDVSLPPALTPKPTRPPARMSAEDLELRNRLLRKYVQNYVTVANVDEGFGYAFSALAVYGLLVGVSNLQNGDHALGAAWTAGYGASTLAVATSFAASRDTRVDLLRLVPNFGFGVTLLGNAVAHDSYPLPRLTAAATSGTFFTLAAFDATNALGRQTRLSAVRRDRDRLDAGDVGPDELPAIERDFLGTRNLLGPSWYAIPLGIGAVVSLVPAFQSRTEKAERGWSIATGSLLGVASLCSLLMSDSVSLYAADLNALGLEFVASPTNIGFRYRF